MTDFTVDKSATGGIDTRWRASKHGQSEGRSGTLDVSKFVEGTHYNIGGDGLNTIPSGVAVGKITATGLYAPYAPAAADGTEILAGYINDDAGIPLFRRTGVAKSTKVSFSLLVHGLINAAVLPIAAQRASVKASTKNSGSFVYVD